MTGFLQKIVGGHTGRLPSRVLKLKPMHVTVDAFLPFPTVLQKLAIPEAAGRGSCAACSAPNATPSGCSCRS